MTASSPRILIFTKGGDLNPASRYRFLQFIPYLKAAGFEVKVCPLFPNQYYQLSAEQGRVSRTLTKTHLSLSALGKRLMNLTQASEADLIVVENQLFPYEPGVLEGLLRAFKKPTIFEFDDAIYLTPLHRSKLERILKQATQVIVGNAHLLEFASRVNPNVAIVPTVIDLDSYPPPPAPRAAGPLRIGWVGLPSTLPYVDEILRPLQQLAQEQAIEFQIISSVSRELPGVPTRFIPWSEQGEKHALLELDIGVMPLPDTQWTRGKCGAKLLQYMAAGRAAIASPVGVNTSIIEQGENGFLASTEAEWLDAFRTLCQSATLRQQIGQAGYHTVKEHYSLQSWGPKVAELYHAVLDRS